MLSQLSKYQAGADKEEDGMAALNRLVGIAKVKEQVEQFVAMAEFNQKSLNNGIVEHDSRTLFLELGIGRPPRLRILNILFQRGLSSRRNSSKFRGAIWLRPRSNSLERRAKS